MTGGAEAFRQGVVAAACGRPECPYLLEDQRRARWLSGYWSWLHPGDAPELTVTHRQMLVIAYAKDGVYVDETHTYLREARFFARSNLLAIAPVSEVGTPGSPTMFFIQSTEEGLKRLQGARWPFGKEGK